MKLESMFDAQELAKQFLQQEVEAIEVQLATEGANHHKGYDDFFDNLDIYRDVLIDDFRMEEYDNVKEDLDEFLKNNNIQVDLETVLYKMLLRRFLNAKIDALKAGMDMCIGIDYDYLNISKIKINVPVKDFDAKSKSEYNSIGKWKQVVQQRRQQYVNTEAKKIMLQYPKISKEILAEDVVEAIKKYRLKPVGGSTILRDYLDSFPNF